MLIGTRRWEYSLLLNRPCLDDFFVKKRCKRLCRSFSRIKQTDHFFARLILFIFHFYFSKIPNFATSSSKTRLYIASSNWYPSYWRRRRALICWLEFPLDLLSVTFERECLIEVIHASWGPSSLTVRVSISNFLLAVAADEFQEKQNQHRSTDRCVIQRRTLKIQLRKPSSTYLIWKQKC